MIRNAFKKVGMTTIFDADGTAKPVTILKLQSAKVSRIDQLQDGRQVVVVDYDLGVKSPLTKGWVKAEGQDIKPGDAISSPEFQAGQLVKVTGSTKGRGFQDVITRHGFAGGPASHGSRFHRAPGSVGMRTEPGRTIRGKKLPGQYGNVQITLSNVKVAYWSADKNILAVLGGVPGARGSVVLI